MLFTLLYCSSAAESVCAWLFLEHPLPGICVWPFAKNNFLAYLGHQMIHRGGFGDFNWLFMGLQVDGPVLVNAGSPPLKRLFF